jgi:hypothetical protein
LSTCTSAINPASIRTPVAAPANAQFRAEGELGQFVGSIPSFALPIPEHIHA